MLEDASLVESSHGRLELIDSLLIFQLPLLLFLQQVKPSPSWLIRRNNVLTESNGNGWNGQMRPSSKLREGR